MKHYHKWLSICGNCMIGSSTPHTHSMSQCELHASFNNVLKWLSNGVRKIKYAQWFHINKTHTFALIYHHGIKLFEKWNTGHWIQLLIVFVNGLLREKHFAYGSDDCNYIVYNYRRMEKRSRSQEKSVNKHNIYICRSGPLAAAAWPTKSWATNYAWKVTNKCVRLPNRVHVVWLNLCDSVISRRQC